MSRQDEALKTFIAMKRTINNFEIQSRKQIGQFNLNMNEFAVLEILFHKGVRTTQQLKEGILIANSSTTYIVDNLEKKGYVFREFSQEDKRIILVDLTHNGRQLMSDIFPMHAELLTNNFDRLTIGEITQIRQLLKKMNGIQDPEPGKD
ncbi:TPA: MarR family winged helix-turn-helix transcriptional regulator [Streptococcus suis]